MKHDEQCEARGRDDHDRWPSCGCATRIYLASCTDEEREAFVSRTGYDRSVDSNGVVI